MSSPPCVSVVVPFLNSERTIQSCIESLLEQDTGGERYEIIMVDNGSTDGSAAIAKRHRDLIVLDEPNPGAYAARNTGIRAATARLTAFTDADCVVDRDWLRSILDGLRQPQTAVLLGHCRYPLDASLPLRFLSAYENAKAEYVINHCHPAHHFAYCNNMAVRTSVFEQVGPFEEWPRAADSELVHRLAAQRPDLELVYSPSMRVTHLEFVRATARTRRLRLYQGTNSRISTFRELGIRQRLAVLMHLARGYRSD